MKLTEYEGKAIFSKYGIKIPKGIVIHSPKDMKLFPGDEFVVKAQVLVGSRKKKGLIRSAKKSEVEKTCRELFNSKDYKIDQILIEEQIPFEKEQYLSLSIDGFSRSIVVLYSEQGGIDIEELSEKWSEEIIRCNLEELNLNVFSNLAYKNQLMSIIAKLKKIMLDYDAELVEINPLVFAGNELIALDSKIIIDDNALFRHEEFKDRKYRGMTDIEKKASENGLHYVDLNGSIGVIGCGAGLVMATLDLLKLNGLEASNFLDVGGGASAEKMKLALELLTMKKEVRAVLINIFGGITRCDEIARAIVAFRTQIPLVVRMIGTNEKEGKKILSEQGIQAVDSIDEGIEAIKHVHNNK